MSRFGLALLLSACGAGAPAHVAAPIALARADGALVPIACGGPGGIEAGAACLAHLPAGAKLQVGGPVDVIAPAPAPGPCQGGALALPYSGAAEVAAWPAEVFIRAQRVEASPEERDRVQALVTHAAPDAKDAVITVALRADLDGDEKDDTIYVVRASGLNAIVGAPGGPGSLRFIQYSDVETYDLLGVVDLDPAVLGRQLVVRARAPGTTQLLVVRFSGEIVGSTLCPGRAP
jgi:hypothetical protein